MKRSDRDLGMNRPISRRDVLYGIGAITASVTLPGCFSVKQVRAPQETGVYPPALTGLRGNHVGSFEIAHQLAREGRNDWGKVLEPDSATYDLVVVGGGISGLSAAHFYLGEHPNARILILENHDDFGGHAKRNEFQIGGRTLIGYGGSETLVAPSSYGDIVKGLLRDLGVEIKRFEEAYDQDFFKRQRLRPSMYFNKEKWGVDRTVPLYMADSVAQIPISDGAKAQFRRLLTTEEDQIPHIPADAKRKYLSSISYRDFLRKHLDITEPEVFALLQDMPTELGVGIEATTAYRAMSVSDLPGWYAAGLPDDDEESEPYIHHFPDGNASIARLLVRRMIPAVAPGNSMEDIVTARIDYSNLDQVDSPLRLRLGSTVTSVQHEGDPKLAKRVLISYVRDGQSYRVKASGCVLACYNSIIPYLCPEPPQPQREALAHQVKSPILATNVALSNWQAWKKQGISYVLCPGSYHVGASLDFPVSLGDYSYSGGPDEPVVVRMWRYPHVNNQELTDREQYRRGRYELLSTSFETIERNVRTQLGGMLGEAGFDPATDIKGITTNRWAHGYSYWYNPLFDTVYDDYSDERYPHMRARKRFGRITIANCDAAADAMFEAAVEQAHRAVTELILEKKP
jgi:spermidine dehydrogenase